MTAPRAPFTAPDQPIRDISTPLEVYDLGTVDYVEMWDRQAELAAQRADGLINDQLLFLEHPTTYPAGKRSQPEVRPTTGLPVVDVDRGGRITWHGPGQLVCYPIIKLAEPVDVVDYVRRVEEAIIQVVRDLGLQDAGRVDGRSGVWIPGNDTRPERKVGALGIRVTRGVTMHGLALNCNNTLEFYQHIVPCGIADAGVTTLSAELGRDVDTHDMIAPLAAALGAAFSGELTVADHSFTRREQP